MSSTRTIRTSCCVAAQGERPREEPRPRRVPQHRRRRDVDADAVRRRQHRRAEDRARVRHAERRSSRRPSPTTRRRTPPAGGLGGGGGRGGPQTGPTSTKLFKSTDGGVDVEGDHRRRTSRASHGQARGSPWPTNTNAQRVFVIGDCGALPLRRRRRDLAADGRRRSANSKRPGRLQLRRVRRSAESGHRLHAQHRELQVHRRRQDLHRLQGRARRRRSAADVDRSDERPAHALRLRPGRDRLARRRRARGARGTTSRPSRSTTSRSTTRFRTGSTATQQDAGAIRTRIRGNLGAITPLDWNPVLGLGVGHDRRRSARPEHRLRERLGHSEDHVSERAVDQREPGAGSRRASCARRATSRSCSRRGTSTCSSPAFQSVWTTIDGGVHWTSISPDLAVRPDAPPPRRRRPRPPGGAIESMSPSTVGTGTIWVGTNNGLIKVTHDAGKTWSDASIPGIPNVQRAEVLCVDRRTSTPPRRTPCSDSTRLGDYTPYVYRTRDFGQDVDADRRTASRRISRAGASRASCATTRSERGLLFAGTESGMYVSFDDGDHWQSLQLEPADHVVPRHRDQGQRPRGRDVRARLLGARRLSRCCGRSRRASRARPAHLFKPGDAVRVRRNVGADTPFPPEVPHALNPPDGVHGRLLARAGAARRHHARRARRVGRARATHVERGRSRPCPKPRVRPSRTSGSRRPSRCRRTPAANRTNWDLRYDSPQRVHALVRDQRESGAHAGVAGGTARASGHVHAQAHGRRQELHADGERQARSALAGDASRRSRAQHALQMKLVQGINASYEGRRMAQALRDTLRAAANHAGDGAAIVNRLAAQLDTIAGVGGGGRGRGRGGQGGTPNFQALNGAMVASAQYAGLGRLGANIIRARCIRRKLPGLGEDGGGVAEGDGGADRNQFESEVGGRASGCGGPSRDDKDSRLLSVWHELARRISRIGRRALLRAGDRSMSRSYEQRPRV